MISRAISRTPEEERASERPKWKTSEAVSSAAMPLCQSLGSVQFLGQASNHRRRRDADRERDRQGEKSTGAVRRQDDAAAHGAGRRPQNACLPPSLSPPSLPPLRSANSRDSLQSGGGGGGRQSPHPPKLPEVRWKIGWGAGAERAALSRHSTWQPKNRQHRKRSSSLNHFSPPLCCMSA